MNEQISYLSDLFLFQDILTLFLPRIDHCKIIGDVYKTVTSIQLTIQVFFELSAKPISHTNQTGAV